MISDVPHAIVKSNEHHIKKLNIKIRLRFYRCISKCRWLPGRSRNVRRAMGFIYVATIIYTPLVTLRPLIENCREFLGQASSPSERAGGEVKGRVKRPG